MPPLTQIQTVQKVPLLKGAILSSNDNRYHRSPSTISEKHQTIEPENENDLEEFATHSTVGNRREYPTHWTVLRLQQFAQKQEELFESFVTRSLSPPRRSGPVYEVSLT